MGPDDIVIYGAGGFGREVAWLVEEAAHPARPLRVVAFVDDASAGEVVNGIDVMTLDAARERFPDAAVIGATGAPSVRERLMARAAAAGFGFATVVHPGVARSRFVEIGTGTVICAGTIITTNIVIGDHVHVNLDCTIGHDARLDDYATLAPGVHVSGYVHIGKRAYIGTGASLINGVAAEPLVVGDDAVVGAGACVIKSVPAGEVAVGVPAKPRSRS